MKLKSNKTVHAKHRSMGGPARGKLAVTRFGRMAVCIAGYMCALSFGSAVYAGSWDPNHSGPEGFTDADASAMVAAADFATSIYVVTSAQKGTTKSAFTFATYGLEPQPVWRLTVVCHAHPGRGGGWVAGNCYIPGWTNWEMTTPTGDVNVIARLPNGGTFPGDERYPHQMNAR
jgi:hypothetical protein